MITDELATTKVAPSDPRDDDTASAAVLGAPQYPSRYEFRSHIATGAMGYVDLVDDSIVGRTTAIKTMLPNALGEQTARQFENEAKILGQLEHPNIVPLYDLELDEHASFFTMRYVKGQTLRAIIDDMVAGCQQTLKRYTWARRARIIQQLCEAIDYAHARGIIHCDLKPANIMIGPFGELVVMDWGIAVALSDNDSLPGDGEELKGLDAEDERKDIVGSPAYLSPEVVTGVQAVSRARDIFAIGAITYELFGLRRPFEGDSVMETFQSVRDQTPKALYSIRNAGQRTVPVELHYICMGALKKDPRERYQSCAEIADHLQLYLDGRFPIRCASTALKRLSQKVTHIIDDHPKKAVCAAVAIGLALVAVTLFGWV